MGKVITPSLAKLVKHKCICDGDLSPITAQIVLTNKCNLNCAFCTEHSRDFGVYINKDLLYSILDRLTSLGCRGVQYTGGGEPTLYAEFPEVIKRTASLGFKIGMNTNAIKLSDPRIVEILECFDWIKVSLNASKATFNDVCGVDKYDEVVESLRILNETNIVFGISYVYSGVENPIEDLAALVKDLVLNEKLTNMRYIRIVPDIHKRLPQRKEQELVFSIVSEIISGTEITIDFNLNRDLHIPNECVLYKIKPRIDADGIVYPCCVAEYKKFNGIGTFDDYYSMIVAGKTIDIDTSKCPYCLYGTINEYASFFEESEVVNPDFI